MVEGLLVFVLASLAISDGLELPYWREVLPVLVLTNAVLFLAIWRRRISFWAVELALLALLLLGIFGYLVTWQLAPDHVGSDLTVVYLVLLWSGMAFPLCFLVFGTHGGLAASLGVYILLLLLALPPVVRGEATDDTISSTTLVLGIAGFFAVMIALLWVLASRLEILAAARTQVAMLARQATTDVLTALPNRRQLDDELARSIARAHRHHEPLSIALIDLDHFKDVNDEHGHEVGDHVLKVVAARLTVAVRTSDVLGRWGGEEFLLIAPRTEVASAVDLAERCRLALAEVPFADVGNLTASFGVTALTAGEDPRALLRRADAALYVAKRDGRNRVRTVDGALVSR